MIAIIYTVQTKYWDESALARLDVKSARPPKIGAIALRMASPTIILSPSFSRDSFLVKVKLHRKSGLRVCPESFPRKMLAIPEVAAIRSQPMNRGNPQLS